MTNSRFGKQMVSEKDRKITRRDFLHLGAGGLAAAGALFTESQVFASTGKPNFVIFYTDDQGIGDLGCFGAGDIRTPNMDSLAAGGVKFTNWYSSSPVCSPSRASLLTGRYPQRTGASRILKAGRNTSGLYGDEITIAGALKAHGYRTGCFGKWHLGSAPESRPNAQGFDEFYGFLAGCVDYYSHIMYWESDTFQPHDLWKNNQEVWENGTYLTDIITREAVRFIHQNAGGPFFLYVPYNSPHYPMHAPRDYFDRYSHLDHHRCQQAAMIATVDDSMGEILEALEQEGLTDNTVIFFQSDNGATIEQRCLQDDSGDFYHGGSNAPYTGWKGGLFEGGIHMPAILKAPGIIPAGSVCDEPGCAIDILPTLLRMAGVDLPGDRIIDGRNILPMALGREKTPHEMLFWQFRDQMAVRQGKWKLILNGHYSFKKEATDPKVFLADLEADPGEKTNLHARYPEITSRLSKICHVMQEDVNNRR